MRQSATNAPGNASENNAKNNYYLSSMSLRSAIRNTIIDYLCETNCTICDVLHMKHDPEAVSL